MTNSVVEKTSGKRERLVQSAAELMHRQGVERTTLAQIAEAARVPPGNVYYYFKTRDDLVAAVIDSQAAQVRELLSSLERRRTPAARLKGLARNWAEASELVAAHGCPIGSLSMELNAPGDPLDGQAARMFEILIDWGAQQFREMGQRDGRGLAIALLAGVQGAAVLSNAFHDPEVMTGEVRRLQRWVDSLA
jgi:AcrR family transcriptional regulator